MNQIIFDRLDQLFVEEPILRASGASPHEIQAAEQTLGVVFSEDYRWFLHMYGGAVVGPYAIYGLSRSELMDEKLWSVVSVTEHFRKQSWPGTAGAYVISMDHAGNPIGIDETGRAVSFDHDAGEMIEVANDFGSYLESCLARLPKAHAS
jgi:hypothetical protein